MIRNRLKELMDVRGLKATRIANDISNLSRNTINSTVNNNGKMIQFETVNLLCQYLGVTPSEFFEYLPFDVFSSIDADSDPIISLDENYNIPAELCFIKPFYLNLYLTQTFNNYSAGENKRTFELSVVSEKPITFHSSEDFANDFVMDNPSFKVVLGNPPIETNMHSQKANFFHFWNDELTEGFRRVVQNMIVNSITYYFSWFQSNNKYITLPSTYPTTFRFDDFSSDYSKLCNGIVLTNQDTTFN